MATVEGITIRHYDNFIDLFEDMEKYIRNKPDEGGGRHAKFLSWDAYNGKGKEVDFFGFVEVLTDDGDVHAYGCAYTRDNEMYMLRRWNDKVDEWERAHEKGDVSYSDEVYTFVTQWWMPCFVEVGFGIYGVSLWG